MLASNVKITPMQTTPAKAHDAMKGWMPTLAQKASITGGHRLA